LSPSCIKSVIGTLRPFRVHVQSSPHDSSRRVAHSRRCRSRRTPNRFASIRAYAGCIKRLDALPGNLSREMHRAARLFAGAGRHAFGGSRARAITPPDG
jgi:hypothetical protein